MASHFHQKALNSLRMQGANTLQLQFATLHRSGWHLEYSGISETWGHEIYLFVPGVKSKTDSSTSVHPFALSQEEREVVLISYFGPDQVVHLFVCGEIQSGDSGLSRTKCWLFQLFLVKTGHVTNRL